ncbi:Hyccin [Acipenser ruthenus]|uniref:Hyccin n=1 Tax=Acipenser ruthenus TaxID=7906 RepID=A0A444TXF8_ACIRT|nr:Hyccin [Acipenser ruthenus]
MGMVEVVQLVRGKGRWFQTLPETAIPSYAAGLKDKASLVSALYRVIQEPQSELLEPVCHQLFEFYRSGEASLQRFTLQFLPEFIWSYLSICTSRELHSTGCREALLLGIYNLEIVDKDGQSKVLSFTVPSLSKPSVYHEPSTIGSLTLTEGALAKHGLSRVVYSGPHPQREIFTAQNRCYGSKGQQLHHVKYSICTQVGNAIKSSLPGGALKSNKEGTRCIQVEITPTSSRISRNAVTSLSIRGHRWKRNAITFLLSSSLLDSSENSIDIPDSAALSVPEISVTGVLGERVGNGETQRSRGEGEAQGGQDSGADSRADSKGLAEELMEISEMDEGFCSRAASNATPPVIIISSSSGKTPGKSQRKSGSSRAGKEREASVESCRDHLSRKQAQRAMSENLELLSLKRLTLTTSHSLPKPGSLSLARTATAVFSRSFEQQAQRAMSENLELLSLKRLTLTTSHSLPKPGSLSLARTATAVFSRSFEQVSNVFGANNPASTGNTTSTEANRYSACSLQEEKLAYVSERTELLGPSSRHKQRSPSIGIQLSTDL